jgi:hypothetical protein
LERLGLLNWLCVGLSSLLVAGYLGVDAYFLATSPQVTFLVGENVFWLVLYAISAYLCFRRSRYRALVLLIAGANAGRISRTIVDPYGQIGTAMISTHLSLLFLIIVLGLLILWSLLVERRGIPESNP